MLLVDLIIANDKAANRGECNWQLARQGGARAHSSGQIRSPSLEDLSSLNMEVLPVQVSCSVCFTQEQHHCRRRCERWCFRRCTLSSCGTRRR